ncbi:hypothetical protein IEQ34_019630 [Dendrobium chrysotoxum]|uniref:TMEM205-like domain-containing protein n=1 Tax=Dendrobium chrysotoxum TaxID=161865 RepID=A0AAV7G7W7_DENCH|nr:hypothetical protein IEQ34_019630 [Dendrobium chrysotoxum]
MMNLLSLSLLISSLAAAGFLSSPPPPPPPPGPVPPIREGHRIFVVEYERQLPTPSSPPPPPPPPPPVYGDFSGDFKDAASDISNSPKEKISSLVTKSKHKAAQLEESSADAAKALSEKAKNAGEEVAANISATTRKPVHRAEAAVAKLEENITDIMRRARGLLRHVAVHVLHGATRAARSAAAVAHLLGFTFAFGTCVWVTFASSHVLASALPRQQFGIVQSRIYPVYFGVVALGVGAAVVAFFIESRWQSAADKAQGFNLLAVLATVIVNMLYLEPRATKVMFERMKLEKEEAKGRDIADSGVEPAVMGPRATPIGLEQTTKVSETMEVETVKSRMSRANKTLRRFNTCSSFLNVLSLMALSWHLVYLAQRMELRS